MKSSDTTERKSEWSPKTYLYKKVKWEEIFERIGIRNPDKKNRYFWIKKIYKEIFPEDIWIDEQESISNYKLIYLNMIERLWWWKTHCITNEMLLKNFFTPQIKRINEEKRKKIDNKRLLLRRIIRQIIFQTEWNKKEEFIAPEVQTKYERIK